MNPVIPKRELVRLMKRFQQDKNRGIPLELFCELAGIQHQTFLNAFIWECAPISELTQRKVSKAYQEWRDGQIRVLADRKRKKSIEYRPVPKPLLRRGNTLMVENGRIVLKPGIVNHADYSRPSLTEQLENTHARR